ncbi:hypothetical protein J3F83DRAFT_743282 [Trichoderma novae-zelandiae]
MDPTTTLVSFMFQTEPSVQSVRLIGSWDNFTMCYSMERDSRRGHGQWRGCFTFQNIIYEHGSPRHHKRSGGLKMGHTYFYYYEVDGSTETFDTTMPYTTACPYMPGQTVNTLQVPTERTARFRSASMNSVRLEDFRTMDPATKFMKPLPPTPLSSGTAKRRAQSAPVTQPSLSASRSTSPPLWKRIFSRKLETTDSQRVLSAGPQEITFTTYDNVISVSPPYARSGRHVSSLSESDRSRDISPSSLSRILREGSQAARLPSHTAQLPPLKIPEDVIEEDEEEDEDFAPSAISESLPFVTVLSPPPFQRSSSAASVKRGTEADSSSYPAAKPKLSVRAPSLDRSQPISAVVNETKSAHEWSVPRRDRITTSPLHEDVPMSFYDDEDDDDDEVVSSNEDEGHFPPPLVSQSRLTSFKGYSLPRHMEETKDTFIHQQAFTYRSSPKLLPDGSNLPNTHVEAGLNKFVSELGWIAGAIDIRD